jgi:hypothetical protein
MNFILIFAAMPLLCGAIASCLVIRDRMKKHAAMAPRHARGLLIHSLTFVLVSAAISVLSAGRPANAQEIIHARAGQIVATNPTAKTLTLKVADGSTVVFQDVASPEPALSFDKEVRSKTVAADTFKNVGAYVVVFYFGIYTPTAVAVKELGVAAPQRSTGSVAGFDRHQHLLLLKAGPAGPQKMVVSDDTIVDTPEGVVRPANFHPGKGEQLRCFTAPQSETAVFVAPN